MSMQLTISSERAARELVAVLVQDVKNCNGAKSPICYHHVRSLAWLIQAEDQPQTKRELYNAVQRRLYREAKNDGWHREKRGMKYAQRVVAESDLPAIVGESSGTDGDFL